MAYKSESDLAKDEKLDLAATLVRFKHRSLANRELNEIKKNISDSHDIEVTDGNWTQLDLESIGINFLQRGLPSAEKNKSQSRASSASTKQ